MRLPEIENPHYQHAFKRGYRHALNGKAVFDMPTDFRQDQKMRHYFEMGWQQANDHLAIQQKAQGKPNWKNRSIWLAFMVISGLLTAKLMIDSYQQEREELQARISPQTTDFSSETPANTRDLRLLNEEAYSDLKKTAKTFAQTQTLKLQPIVDSELIIEKFELTSLANGKSYPESSLIPKFERQLKANSQIKSPNEAEILVRWIYGNQLIDSQTFELVKGLNLIQTQQAMSSARQGKWFIEFLTNNRVIHRQEFNYGFNEITHKKVQNENS
ncbi:hypothetical protein [Thiomicrorhabdus indica]|uniref:hypothetical protein n=1 Tax=Thiomicrorhabdus indica TaxID=2267253 RepID=UPI00102DE673|nr:hypothetical protein [Thiomicrorhabdus indica]